MSNSLRPWIADYLLRVALSDKCTLTGTLDLEKSSRKVQIIKFITYQDNANDDCVWARVSDGEHMLPAKFTQESLDMYRSAAGGDEARRFTSHEGGIFTIQHFRPSCNRVPAGHNKGMSANKHVFLEVGSAKLFGSSGEPTIRNPVDVEAHSELGVWAAGLKMGGAGGRRLKEMKEGQANSVPSPVMRDPLDRPAFLPTLLAPRNGDASVPRPPNFPLKPQHMAPTAHAKLTSDSSLIKAASEAQVADTVNGDKDAALSTTWSSRFVRPPSSPAQNTNDTTTYVRSWRAARQFLKVYRRKPEGLQAILDNLPIIGDATNNEDEILEAGQVEERKSTPPSPPRPQNIQPRRHPLDLGSSQPQPSPPQSPEFSPRRATTPDRWSPTQPSRSSPGLVKESKHRTGSVTSDNARAEDDDLAPGASDADAMRGDRNKEHDPLLKSDSPTPPQSSYVSAPPLAQPRPVLSPSPIPSHKSPSNSSQPHAQPSGRLPDSSPHSYSRSQNFQSSGFPSSPAHGDHVPRRVPRPPPPPHPIGCPPSSGPGQVLVPNSDTSMSQSQSLPRSQIRKHDLGQEDSVVHSPVQISPKEANGGHSAHGTHPLSAQSMIVRRSTSQTSSGARSEGSGQVSPVVAQPAHDVVDMEGGSSVELEKDSLPKPNDSLEDVSEREEGVRARRSLSARPAFRFSARPLHKLLSVTPPSAEPSSAHNRLIRNSQSPDLLSPKDALQTTMSILRHAARLPTSSCGPRARPSLPSLIDASAFPFKPPTRPQHGDVFGASRSPSPQKRESPVQVACDASVVAAANGAPNADDDSPEEASEKVGGAQTTVSVRARRMVTTSTSSSHIQALLQTRRLSAVRRSSSTASATGDGRQATRAGPSAMTSDHDPDTWRTPSFMRRSKDGANVLPVSRASSASTVIRESMVGRANSTRGSSLVSSKDRVMMDGAATTLGRDANLASMLRTSSKDSVLPRGMKRLKMGDDDDEEPNGSLNATRPTKKMKTLDRPSMRTTPASSSSSFNCAKDASSLCPTETKAASSAKVRPPFATDIPIPVESKHMEVDMHVPVAKLGGWKPSLDFSISDHPHLVSRAQLQDIILRTGRYRNKEVKAQKKAKGQAR